MLRLADVFYAKAQRQQHGFICAKAQQQHDVGHPDVFTGCEVLSLSSSISADVCTPAEIS
ncbi:MULTISPECIES: hypothetical protein [Lysinibacillus]|uniref:hypothetical protein n=1 Tax=Lysinibacillus TaxID=400634 RepID=UPI001CC052A7|nr:hypothetical protein [Lysinibacillus sphaericus]